MTRERSFLKSLFVLKVANKSSFGLFYVKPLSDLHHLAQYTNANMAVTSAAKERTIQ